MHHHDDQDEKNDWSKQRKRHPVAMPQADHEKGEPEEIGTCDQHDSPEGITAGDHADRGEDRTENDDEKQDDDRQQGNRHSPTSLQDADDGAFDADQCLSERLVHRAGDVVLDIAERLLVAGSRQQLGKVHVVADRVPDPLESAGIHEGVVAYQEVLSDGVGEEGGLELLLESKRNPEHGDEVHHHDDKVDPQLGLLQRVAAEQVAFGG